MSIINRRDEQRPGTRRPAPGTRRTHDTRHQTPGTRHQTPGTRHQAPGTRRLYSAVSTCIAERGALSKKALTTTKT